MPVFLISIPITCVVEGAERTAVGFDSGLVALFVGDYFEVIGCKFGSYFGVHSPG